MTQCFVCTTFAMMVNIVQRLPIKVNNTSEEQGSSAEGHHNASLHFSWLEL
jgi:hypothetical protein